MQAMIFAAGLGTRLRPLTNDRPKALVEIGGRTLIEHNILRLREAGFTRIVVNVHHFADQIIDFLTAHHNFDLDICVSDERELLLDTGGGIRKALPLLTSDEPVLIHNVDIVSDIDLRGFYHSHQEGFLATLGVNHRKTQRYLQFTSDHCLCGWQNVKTGEQKGLLGEPFAFTGIHVIDPSAFPLFAKHPEEAFPLVPFYLNLCQIHDIHCVDLTNSAWVDCGKVEALEMAKRIVESLEVRVE